MKLYQVSFWSEGPGRSGINTVLVFAKNKIAAVKFVIKKCGVYTADQPYVKALAVDLNKYKNGIFAADIF